MNRIDELYSYIHQNQFYISISESTIKKEMERIENSKNLIIGWKKEIEDIQKNMGEIVNE